MVRKHPEIVYSPKSVMLEHAFCIGGEPLDIRLALRVGTTQKREVTTVGFLDLGLCLITVDVGVHPPGFLLLANRVAPNHPHQRQEGTCDSAHSISLRAVDLLTLVASPFPRYA